MFKIAWAGDHHSIQKWLRLEGNNAVIIDGEESATVFTRSEADSVLLALHNSGYWRLGGNVVWPHLVGVS
jgi:hypothetical protein